MSGVAAMVQNVQQVRRLAPVALVPALVQRRAEKLLANPAFRAQQEGEMRFLLEHTSRAAEIPALTERYTEQMLVRSWMRWHPRAITRQRVKGIEWLTTKADPSRSAVLSFMHHHRYDGMFASLRREGAKLHIVVNPVVAGPDADVNFKQHMRVVSRGGDIVRAGGGTEGIVAMLEPGVTLAIASDFPGRTPVTFLGRRVLGAFGAARIPTLTNSPVIMVTAQRDDAGPFLQVHEPLEPSSYADPADLLDDLLVRHGEAILAWPEAFESPTARFGALDEDTTTP